VFSFWEDDDTMGCSYRDLIVWQKATAMVTDIYRSTQHFSSGGNVWLDQPAKMSSICCQ